MEYKLTNHVQDESLSALNRIMSYPSVLAENDSKTPFGKNIQECLEAVLKECQLIGMKTFIDPKGYYGYAEIGEGEELLVVLCHIDVVPVSDKNEWKYDPFKLTIDNGIMYGRGSQDDKGPSIAALYALKALLDHGIKLNKRVRFVFGTDEENLWRCMNRYNQVEEKATLGFVPDADFPLTYAEKGLLQFYLEGPGSSEFSINNDYSFNVVPDSAKFQDKFSPKIKEELKKLGYSFIDNGEEIIVNGKSVHAKDADKGVNAISRLVEAISKYYDHPTLNFLSNYLKEPTAKKIFGNVYDEISGNLTLNVSKLLINEDESKIGFDMRIPVTADKEQLILKLTKIAEEYHLAYREFDYLRSLYVPIKSQLIQTLLGVYRKLTNDMSDPISSGGATFARTMDNCVAFGARFANVPVTFHQVDECMPLSNFFDAMEIYANAIKELASH